MGELATIAGGRGWAADGRELLQGQADVSPRVPRTNLRRPVEGERQHAELHVADDLVGGPVVDKRPPLTGAPPSDLSESLRYIVDFQPAHPLRFPRSKHSQPLISTGQTPRHSHPRTVWNYPCKFPVVNLLNGARECRRGTGKRCERARLGPVLKVTRSAEGERRLVRRGMAGNFAPPATLPQTGPEGIVTTDTHRVPEMDQSTTKEAKGGRFRTDVQ